MTLPRPQGDRKQPFHGGTNPTWRNVDQNEQNSPACYNCMWSDVGGEERN